MCVCVILFSVVRFSSTTPALEEDEVVVFEYGQRASLSCSFESDFPDLSVQWTPSDLFSFPGVFSSVAGGSVDLTIVQFTQDHEVTIECVGSASGGTAQKLISLRGTEAVTFVDCTMIFFCLSTHARTNGHAQTHSVHLSFRRTKVIPHGTSCLWSPVSNNNN